jgi:hypothetical protein
VAKAEVRQGNKVFDLLRTQGLRRGVLGQSRGWLAVWLAITATRQVRKHLGKEPVLVERLVLKPGQRVVIEDTAVPWGKAKP